MSMQHTLSECEPQRRGVNELALKTHSSSVSSKQSYGVSSSRSVQLSASQLTTVCVRQAMVNQAQGLLTDNSNEVTTLSNGAIGYQNQRPSYATKEGCAAPSLSVAELSAVATNGSTVCKRLIVKDTPKEHCAAQPLLIENDNAQKTNDWNTSVAMTGCLEVESTPAPSSGPRQCSLCRRYLTDPDDPVQHKRMCQEKKLFCPLLCGKLLRRGDITRHVRETALEHNPLPLPSGPDYPEEHPAHVLAVVMNMFLEKNSGDKRADEQFSLDLPPRRIRLSETSSSSVAASRRLSLNSTLCEKKPESDAVTPPKIQTSADVPLTQSSTGLPEPQARSPPTISQERDITYTIESELTSGNDNSVAATDANDNNTSTFGKASAAVSAEEPDAARTTSELYNSRVPRKRSHSSNVESGCTSRSGGFGMANCKGFRPEAPVSKGSSENGQALKELLIRINLQHEEVEKLREQRGAYDLSNVEDVKQRDEIMDAVRNVVTAFDGKNRSIHNDCKQLMGKTSLAPDLFLNVLHSWRSLDRHWNEVRVTLCDTARI
ncbi:hypothetical protein DPX39_030046800 [Trypanosoma brucei equiperdum]|uniref:Uncharacterized protein n=1 Tax=Trypanosoma brucei equiperdum TaxID=630700 RepID=A0A3L6LBQ0_9TRYP|nr:hypothetical protein DPX39_030046800 [Trypanosoma brucei equiperdum]